MPPAPYVNPKKCSRALQKLTHMYINVSSEILNLLVHKYVWSRENVFTLHSHYYWPARLTTYIYSTRSGPGLCNEKANITLHSHNHWYLGWRTERCSLRQPKCLIHYNAGFWLMSQYSKNSNGWVWVSGSPLRATCCTAASSHWMIRVILFVWIRLGGQVRYVHVS